MNNYNKRDYSELSIDSTIMQNNTDDTKRHKYIENNINRQNQYSLMQVGDEKEIGMIIEILPIAILNGKNKYSSIIRECNFSIINNTK
jgi:hypothetical protein